MARAERRGHLQGLLDDVVSQRHVDDDDLRAELIHFLFELDDEVEQLRGQISELVAKAEGSGSE